MCYYAESWDFIHSNNEKNLKKLHNKSFTVLTIQIVENTKELQ